MEGQNLEGRETAIEVELDGSFFSNDAILKACYWYSKQFSFELKSLANGKTLVTLEPKDGVLAKESTAGDFIASVADFTLRERIEKKTAAIRETLLAKAFAESGVLEDSPEGLPLDPVEQDRREGLFKILSHS